MLKKRLKGIGVGLLRDGLFGAGLFIVIVVLVLVSTKAARFIYAMF